MKFHFSLKIVSNYVKKVFQLKVKLQRLPLSDILTQKLTYDGVFQLIKLFYKENCAFADYVISEKFVLIPVVSY